MKRIAQNLNENDNYEATFKYTQGTHFDGYAERIQECIEWLLGF